MWLNKTTSSTFLKYDEWKPNINARVFDCGVLSSIQFNQLFKEKVKDLWSGKLYKQQEKWTISFLVGKKTKPNTNLHSMTHIAIYRQSWARHMAESGQLPVFLPTRFGTFHKVIPYNQSKPAELFSSVLTHSSELANLHIWHTKWYVTKISHQVQLLLVLEW